MRLLALAAASVFRSDTANKITSNSNAGNARVVVNAEGAQKFTPMVEAAMALSRADGGPTAGSTLLAKEHPAWTDQVRTETKQTAAHLGSVWLPAGSDPVAVYCEAHCPRGKAAAQSWTAVGEEFSSLVAPAAVGDAYDGGADWGPTWLKLLEVIPPAPSRRIIPSVRDAYIEAFVPEYREDLRSFFRLVEANYEQYGSHEALQWSVRELSDQFKAKAAAGPSAGGDTYVWLPHVGSKSSYWITAQYYRAEGRAKRSSQPDGVMIGFDSCTDHAAEQFGALTASPALVRGKKYNLQVIDDMSYTGMQFATDMMPELCNALLHKIDAEGWDFDHLSVFAMPIYLTKLSEARIKEAFETENCRALSAGGKVTFDIVTSAVVGLLSRADNAAVAQIRESVCSWARPGFREYMGANFCKDEARPPIYFDHKLASMISAFSEILSVGYVPAEMSASGISSFRRLMVGAPSLDELYPAHPNAFHESYVDQRLVVGVSNGDVKEPVTGSTVSARFNYPDLWGSEARYGFTAAGWVHTLPEPGTGPQEGILEIEAQPREMAILLGERRNPTCITSPYKKPCSMCTPVGSPEYTRPDVVELPVPRGGIAYREYIRAFKAYQEESYADSRARLPPNVHVHPTATDETGEPRQYSYVHKYRIYDGGSWNDKDPWPIPAYEQAELPVIRRDGLDPTLETDGFWISSLQKWKAGTKWPLWIFDWDSTLFPTFEKTMPVEGGYEPRPFPLKTPTSEKTMQVGMAYVPRASFKWALELQWEASAELRELFAELEAVDGLDRVQFFDAAARHFDRAMAATTHHSLPFIVSQGTFDWVLSSCRFLAAWDQLRAAEAVAGEWPAWSEPWCDYLAPMNGGGHATSQILRAMLNKGYAEAQNLYDPHSRIDVPAAPKFLISVLCVPDITLSRGKDYATKVTKLELFREIIVSMEPEEVVIVGDNKDDEIAAGVRLQLESQKGGFAAGTKYTMLPLAPETLPTARFPEQLATIRSAVLCWAGEDAECVGMEPHRAADRVDLGLDSDEAERYLGGHLTDLLND